MFYALILIFGLWPDKSFVLTVRVNYYHVYDI